jgi:hypothetical protein
MTAKYFSCHYGNINNLSWLQSKGFNEVGYVIHYGDAPPSPAPILNAGMVATLNIFNDGSSPPCQMFVDGGQFEPYFQAVANAGWTMIAGEGCTTSVIDSVQKYLPYVNYGGDQANNMYTTPWSHPNTGKGHLDYIETYTRDDCVNNVGGVQGCINAAQAAGALHLGILIGDWCLGTDPGVYINIVDSTGCDTICFWGGYAETGAASSSMQGLADVLIGHYGVAKWSGGVGPAPPPVTPPGPPPSQIPDWALKFSSMSEMDITHLLNNKYDGQPTPGRHTVTVVPDDGTAHIDVHVRVKENQPGNE